MTLLIAAVVIAEAAVIVTAYLLGVARSTAPDWVAQKSRAAVRAEEDALARQVTVLVESGLLTGTADRAGADGCAGCASDRGEGQ